MAAKLTLVLLLAVSRHHSGSEIIVGRRVVEMVVIIGVMMPILA